MTTPVLLQTVLKPEVPIREVCEGIWSAVAVQSSRQIYDRQAALYDRLIGNRLYNRIVWGSSPKSYARFARQAIADGSGILLDGGCGSLVSTAALHIASRRPTVLCDLSIGMLRAARDRILGINGSIPDHLFLVQADLTDLPFADRSFGAVLCPGMLHIFADLESVVRELARVAKNDACMHMSSLVAESWISAGYLNLLHRVGEVAKPRSNAKLMEVLSSISELQLPAKVALEGSVASISVRRRARE